MGRIRQPKMICNDGAVGLATMEGVKD